MNQLCTIRAEEVRPGDVVVFDDPDFLMDVGQVSKVPGGRVGLYARNSDWRVYRMSDAEVQVRLGEAIELEKEQFDRPIDWQDKLVIRASAITCVLCFAIIVWGR